VGKNKWSEWSYKFVTVPEPLKGLLEWILFFTKVFVFNLILDTGYCLYERWNGLKIVFKFYKVFPGNGGFGGLSEKMMS